VRIARKNLGLSQEGLAQAVEMDRSYIGAVERGENVVSIIALLRIAAALQTNASDLLRGIQAEETLPSPKTRVEPTEA
jgi:transcriptional regulator with XRE-family HTH domain